MAVESLLLTAKVGHSSEDFVRRGAFSGVSKFLCDKIFAGDPQVSWPRLTSRKKLFLRRNSTFASLSLAHPSPLEMAKNKTTMAASTQTVSGSLQITLSPTAGDAILTDTIIRDSSSDLVA